MLPLLKGLILGFSIAAPIGPIGLLCIRRTLIEGRISGFVSGLGVATADIFYAIVAIFGMTVVSKIINEYELLIRIVGGLTLIFIAIRIFASESPQKITEENSGLSLVESYISTLFLAITNLSNMLLFAAAFTFLGISNSIGSNGDSILVVVGVFLGSVLWWSILSATFGYVHYKISTKSIVYINRVSGAIMAIWGIASLTLH